MTIVQTAVPARLALFLSSNVILKYGPHPKPKDEEKLPDEACAVELTSWLAGEPWSDRPVCSCPVLSAAVRSRNDRFGTDDVQRTRFLRDVVPALVGSKCDRATELARAYAIVDWSVRDRVPALLHALGQVSDATALRALAGIDSTVTANAARVVAQSIRERQRENSADAADAADAAANAAAAYAAANAAYATAAAYAATAVASVATADAADAYAAADADDAAAAARPSLRERIAGVIEETNRSFAELIKKLSVAPVQV